MDRVRDGLVRRIHPPVVIPRQWDGQRTVAGRLAEQRAEQRPTHSDEHSWRRVAGGGGKPGSLRTASN
eukprot:SAG31_NODE_3362_length_4364_cov_1.463540_3_plen_68_part_00